MLEFSLGREKLASYAINANRGQRQLDAISKLPKKLATVAELLIASHVRSRRLPEDSSPLEELRDIPDRQLEKFLNALFPGLAAPALRTWQSIGRGYYCTFRAPAPLNSPNQPELNFVKQLDWLQKTLGVFIDYPSSITSAEGLAVWAPYFNERLAPNFLGELWEGGEASEHVGRLLASVIDEGGSTSENVFDTLRLVIEDRHPESMFSGHLPRAFWQCDTPEAHDLLIQRLGSDSNAVCRTIIVRAAAESNILHLESVLRVLCERPKLIEEVLASEILSWFGISSIFGSISGSKKVARQMCLYALESLNEQKLGLEIPKDSPSESILFRIWALMTQNIEDAATYFPRLLQSDEAEQRIAALLLAKMIKHRCTEPIALDSLRDSDWRVVRNALEILELLKDLTKRSATEKHELLLRLLEVLQRARKSPAQLKKSLRDEAEDVFYEILSLIRDCWTNESLQLLGDAVREEAFQSLSFLPREYCPPDEFTMDLLAQRGSDISNWDKLAEDRLMLILQNGAMQPKHWCALLETQIESFNRRSHEWFSELQKRPEHEFCSTVELLLENPKTPMQIIGLDLLVQAASSNLRKACTPIAHRFIAKSKTDKKANKRSDQFARMLLKLASSYPTNNDSGDSDVPEILAQHFPKLTLSPPWQPELKPVNRFTQSCVQLLMSLDNFLEKHSAQILASATSYRNQPAQELNDVGWDEQSELENLWQKWYKEVKSVQAADGLDLVRLKTYEHAIIGDYHYAKSLAASGADIEVFKSLELTALSDGSNVDTNCKSKLKHRHLATRIIEHLFRKHAKWEDYSFQLDVAESICTGVTDKLLAQHDSKRLGHLFEKQWINARSWMEVPERLKYQPMPPEIAKRRFYINRFLKLDRFFFSSYIDGSATLGDVALQLLTDASRDYDENWINYRLVSEIRRVSTEKANEWNDFSRELASKIIGSELKRPAKQLTQWSMLASRVGYLEGFDFFETMLIENAKSGFCNFTKSLTNHRNLLSRLTAAFYPESNFDVKACATKLAKLINDRKITELHLLQAGFIAPQWLETIELALAWPNLNKIYHWIREQIGERDLPEVELAAWLVSSNRPHRKQVESDAQRFDNFDIDDWYQRQSDLYYRKRRLRAPTPDTDLDPDELDDFDDDDEPEGSYLNIDVEWYNAITVKMDAKKRSNLLEAMNVLAAPKSVETLQSIMNAIEGVGDREALIKAIQSPKKYVDARPLALMPLATGKERSQDLLERYRALMGYRTAARKMFDRDIATTNCDYSLYLLAQRAGADDVEHLEWMIQIASGEEFHKLNNVKVGTTTIQLVVDATGKPGNIITNNGKVVKTLPASVKKNPQVATQQSLLKSLQKFAVQSRKIGEQAMVNCKAYSLEELAEITAHPILKRLFSSLVFTNGQKLGLLTEDGKQLVSMDDHKFSLKKSDSLRIAHPIDLLAHGGPTRWRDWLRDQQVLQSITQVERGCFLAEHFVSQGSADPPSPVYPKWLEVSQANAILRSLGWESNYGDELFREFPGHEVRAEFRLEYSLSFTVRIAKVIFQIPIDNIYTEVAYDRVPAIPFSEVMRELYIATLGSQKPSDKVDKELSELQGELSEIISNRKLANVHWKSPTHQTLEIEGNLNTYLLDIANKDLLAMPNQRIPLSYFESLPLRKQAPRLNWLTTVLLHLADPELERVALTELKLM